MRISLLLRGIFIPLFLLLFTQTFAQSKKVSGKVTSASGTPMEGVSVQIKGTKTGTTTDKEGLFTFSVPGNTSVLVISSVGYETQEIMVGDQTNISVQLKESSDKLADVIVVGYGTQRKREVTSAITKVTADQFNKGNVNNVAQLLQGKVAGLSIAHPGGDPNAGFSIRLRGLSTLGANTQPLVVIDGQIGADLNTVDPNDIASFDVLKDGSAAAIYGTRGSQGVIIITTKSGKAGVPQVNYSGQVSAEIGRAHV